MVCFVFIHFVQRDAISVRIFFFGYDNSDNRLFALMSYIEQGTKHAVIVCIRPRLQLNHTIQYTFFSETNIESCHIYSNIKHLN